MLTSTATTSGACNVSLVIGGAHPNLPNWATCCYKMGRDLCSAVRMTDVRLSVIDRRHTFVDARTKANQRDEREGDDDALLFPLLFSFRHRTGAKCYSLPVTITFEWVSAEARRERSGWDGTAHPLLTTLVPTHFFHSPKLCPLVRRGGCSKNQADVCVSLIPPSCTRHLTEVQEQISAFL